MSDPDLGSLPVVRQPEKEPVDVLLMEAQALFLEHMLSVQKANTVSQA